MCKIFYSLTFALQYFLRVQHNYCIISLCIIRTTETIAAYLLFLFADGVSGYLQAMIFQTHAFRLLSCIFEGTFVCRKICLRYFYIHLCLFYKGIPKIIFSYHPSSGVCMFLRHFYSTFNFFNFLQLKKLNFQNHNFKNLNKIKTNKYQSLFKKHYLLLFKNKIKTNKYQQYLKECY